MGDRVRPFRGSGSTGVVVAPLIKLVSSPNFWSGRAGHKVIALVVHTMAGTLVGCDAEFGNPATEVSAHYGVGLGSEAHAYVSALNTAWSNGILEAGNGWTSLPESDGSDPNYQTISIETEDTINGVLVDNVPESQYQGVLYVARAMLTIYPDTKYLIGHEVISPLTRPNCPGDRWWNGPMQRLSADLGLQLVR